MRKILIVLLAWCVVLVVGCHLPGIRGNGHIKTEERPVSAFVNLDAGGAFEIEWQNGSPALRITTDENLLPYVENNVSGDTLHLRTREHVWPTHGIKVVISSPTRAGGKIRGAVKLTVKQLRGAIFALESKGASEVVLDGSIDQLLVDMTGASQLSAAGLQAKTAEISTTGAPLLFKRERAMSLCTKLCRIMPAGRQPSSVRIDFSSASRVNSPCTSSIE